MHGTQHDQNTTQSGVLPKKRLRSVTCFMYLQVVRLEVARCLPLTLKDIRVHRPWLQLVTWIPLAGNMAYSI